MSKRGNGEGSIYQRGDGRWVTQVTVGWDGSKPIRRYIYGKSHKDVKDRLTELNHDKLRGLPVKLEKQTVAEYLDRWLQDTVKSSVKPRTYDSYRLHVTRYIAPAIGRVQVQKLTAQQVQAMLNKQLETGLSPRTVQYTRAILRRALNQAVKWDIVARNVASLTTPPRSKKFEIQPLTTEQARTFLDAIRGDRLEALYSVAIAVGLRQGEALGLHWEDIDLDNGTVNVRHQLQRINKRLTIVELKTTRSRRAVALPEVTVNALRKHRVRQLEERLAAGRRWEEHGLVFTSTIGTPLDARNVVRQFKAMLKSADLPDLRFHDLRHTCATLLLVQGVNPRVVMETLGHSQISLTMNTYTHVMPVLQRDAASRINDLLTGSD